MSATRNYSLCKKYMKQHVRITTAQGTFEGQIVKLDRERVYLQMTPPRSSRHQATISFFPFIIPLVLFDLLAIALISTPFRPFF
ncbi:hypothetical protein FPZ49_18785 [Paenibacillus cremeus]|uniref:DUF2642 domain-containing protein n=1 Tax=Paenibacillus cremeus TaxID=2163881 RepID=A0A559K8M3_9BACL|nr:hypothetical protein [Paenibacillus cremeus]TVY08480.1 hypothetical protein FPZ49_18785 [Paenibacillus cremeus]